MTQAIINGNTYSDDGSAVKDMNNGGHRTHFLPLVNDVVTVAGQVAADKATVAADKATAAAGSTNATNKAAEAANYLTQTQTARDQALAGLGAADNSQVLQELLLQLAYQLDLEGKLASELAGLPTGVDNLTRFTASLADLIGVTARAILDLEGKLASELAGLPTGVDNLTRFTASLADLIGVTARAISGGDVLLGNGTVTAPSLGNAWDRNTGIYFPSADQLAIATAGVQRLLVDASGNHATGTDNAQTLGTAAKRWSTVYAGTGTINTSDAREKTPIAPLSTDEIAFAVALSKEVGTYQFLESIAAKGDAARHHIGLTVQRAIELAEDAGLNPFKYGFICYDEWPEIVIEHPAVEEVPSEIDEEGNTTQQGRPAQDAWTEVVQTAGSRYAFRYDQLSLFIAAGLNARLSALEA